MVPLTVEVTSLLFCWHYWPGLKELTWFKRGGALVYCMGYRFGFIAVVQQSTQVQILYY